jgi:hypothetical protein
MTTSKPGLLLLVAAVASLPLACKDGGCGGGAATASSPSASVVSAPSAPGASAAASGSASAHRARPIIVRASNPTGALFRAVNSLELKDDQRATLEKVAADLREAEKAAREGADGGARSEAKEANDELVAGVKAGKIAIAKMESHYAALEKVAKARQDREADALNRLHAALEPSQRTTIAASVRLSETQQAVRMKLSEKPDGGRPNMSRTRLERYTRGIDLDAAQQKKVEAILPKDDRATTLQDEARKYTDAVLVAFEKEGFDAKKLDGGAGKQARAPMEEQVKYFGQLLPILTSEQRERLAKNLGRGSVDLPIRPHRGMGLGGRSHDGLEDDDEVR